MKTIQRFNNFNRIYEAKNPLEQAYLDEVKRRAGEDGMERMRNGEILPPNEFFSNLNLIQQIQSQGNNKQRLEDLAKEVIVEHFGTLLDGINLYMKIVDKNSDEWDEMFQKMVKDEDESQERQDELLDEDEDEDEERNQVNIPAFEMPTDEINLEDEVNKRKLINIFIQGSAKNLHRILHSETSKNGLDEIDPRLFDIFDKTIKTNEFMEWQIPEIHGSDAIRNGANGMNEIDWENSDEADNDDASEFIEDSVNNDNDDLPKDMDLSGGDPTIRAIAIDYMILLHEAVKGIYGIIAQNGYSQIDSEIAKNILTQTDTLADEFHDLKYGTYIRRDLVNFINKNELINRIDNHIEWIFGKLVKYPADGFVDLIWGMIQGTDEARRIIDRIIDEVYADQEDYENQMRGYDAEQALKSEEERNYDIGNDKNNNISIDNDPELSHLSSYSEEELNDMIESYMEDGEYEEASKIEKYLKMKKMNAGSGSGSRSSSKTPQSEVDYSQMSQSELKAEMDDALDNEDFDKARKIQPFLESKKTNIFRFESFKRKN